MFFPLLPNGCLVSIFSLQSFAASFARRATCRVSRPLRSVFNRQLPEWKAATCHRVFSHIMAPTHIMAEKPNHSQIASLTVPFQLVFLFFLQSPRFHLGIPRQLPSIAFARLALSPSSTCWNGLHPNC